MSSKTLRARKIEREIPALESPSERHEVNAPFAGGSHADMACSFEWSVAFITSVFVS